MAAGAPPYLRRGLLWPQTHYLAAPVGGWNPDANAWAMADTQAPVLDNFIIRSGKLVARGPLVTVSKLPAGTALPIAAVLSDASFGSSSPSGTMSVWYKLSNTVQYIDPWNAVLLNAPAANLATAVNQVNQVALDNGYTYTSAFPGLDHVGGPRWINFNGLLYGISYDSSGTVATDVNGTYHMKPLNLLTMPAVQTPGGVILNQSSANGAGADNSGVGTIAWTNPNNVTLVSESSPATASITSSGVSHYLYVTFGGASIPGGATLDGIAVWVDKKSGSGTQLIDNSVVLMKTGGVVAGANKADVSNPWPSSWTNPPELYGGPLDLWSSGVTVTDVNAAGFGVGISVKSQGGADTASVAGVTMVIYYHTDTMPATTILSNAPHGAFDLKGYLSRVWLLGGIDTPGGLTNHEPTTLFYTNPLGTPGAGSPLGTNTADWKDPVTVISNKLTMDNNFPDYGVGLAVIQNAMLIFRRSSVWRLSGSTSSTFTLKPLSREVGCLDARSIVETDHGCYFISARGLMFTDGTSIKNVSGPVQNDLLTAILRVQNTLTNPATFRPGGWYSAALTSQGQILVSIGEASSIDLAHDANYLTVWGGLFDPPTGTWVRITSNLWTAGVTGALPYILVSRPGRGQLYSLGNGANSFQYLVQLENAAYGDYALWGSSFLTTNAAQNTLWDIDKTNLQSPRYPYGTLQRIPYVWVTKIIPMDAAHRQGTSKRIFADMAAAQSSSYGFGGYIALQPFSVNTTLLSGNALESPDRQIAIDSGIGAAAWGGNTSGQVTGGITRVPTTRIRRTSFRTNFEFNDFYFVLQSKQSIGSGPNPGVGLLEVYGIGLDWTGTREYEGGGTPATS